MRNRLIQAVEAACQKTAAPQFEIGDTVEVGVRIVEGGKERVQPFIGVVIGRRGAGTGATFTVRRIVNNEGVERTFPLHSPKVAHVEVIRHGKVRRGKLYFLRERVGKARKLAERRDTAEESSAGGEKPREPAMAGAV
jgi:large subunit ribosomal protein L19